MPWYERQRVARRLFSAHVEAEPDEDGVYRAIYSRQMKCCWTRCGKPGSETELIRSKHNTFRYAGVVTCGHYSCASCGPKRCRFVASHIGAAIRKHRASSPYADAWMLTLTIPHYPDETAILVVDRLYAACAAFYRSAEWRAFESRWGVVGRVRVLDATHSGRNGSHPHFHTALFPTQTVIGIDDGRITSVSMLSASERAAWLNIESEKLKPAWTRSVLAVGAAPRGRAAVAEFDEHGLKLSGSEHAERYFTKWGLQDEVAGVALKRNNHLTLLDLAGAGDVAAGAAYVAFRDAVEGRAWVTGLEDAINAVGVTDEEVEAYAESVREARERQRIADGEAPEVLVPELSLKIRCHLWGAVLRVGHAAVIAEVQRAEVAGEGIQGALDRFLWCSMRAPSTSDPPDAAPS